MTRQSLTAEVTLAPAACEPQSQSCLWSTVRLGYVVMGFWSWDGWMERGVWEGAWRDLHYRGGAAMTEAVSHSKDQLLTPRPAGSGHTTGCLSSNLIFFIKVEISPTPLFPLHFSFFSPPNISLPSPHPWADLSSRIHSGLHSCSFCSQPQRLLAQGGDNSKRSNKYPSLLRAAATSQLLAEQDCPGDPVCG